MMTSLDIYENIIIGNFLFDLGVKMGLAQPPTPPVSVNLLQQTPLDKALGDVLLSDSRTFRLVEFKRTGGDAAKERDKLSQLDFRLASQPRLKALSRKIHWYVESDFRHAGPTPIRVIPYLDLLTRSIALTLDISAFEDGIVNEVLNPTADKREHHECRHYLELVARCTSGKIAASGALFVAVNEKRELKHVAIDDIRDLFLLSPSRFQKRPPAERERAAPIRDSKKGSIWQRLDDAKRALDLDRDRGGSGHER